MIIIMDHLTLCSNNNNECWSSFCKKNSLLPSSIQRFFLFLDLYRNPELEKRRKDILQLRFSILDLVLRWIIEFYSMKSKLFIQIFFKKNIHEDLLFALLRICFFFWKIQKSYRFFQLNHFFLLQYPILCFQSIDFEIKNNPKRFSKRKFPYQEILYGARINSIHSSEIILKEILVNKESNERKNKTFVFFSFKFCLNNPNLIGEYFIEFYLIEFFSSCFNSVMFFPEKNQENLINVCILFWWNFFFPCLKKNSSFFQCEQK